MSYELYTTKHWMILPSFVHGILPTLMYNSNNHIALTFEEKKQPYLAVANGEDFIRDSQVTEDGEVIPRYNWDGTSLLSRMKEPFVNMIPVDGPITRNGDACSYGSKEIRDWLMEAAANKYCRAHVLIVNTPGGSAWAKNDFQQAIDYAHENGQRVYMLIDGLCASAGMYLASFCDEVYVVNLKDQLGCVGVMASFFTLKNGEKNQFNSETYHEYYATKSINKNKEYRDIANDDDATLLIEELDELEADFRSDMQKSFPKATDDHLDGKLFDADEVMGILCDGQMLLGDVVTRAFAVASGTEEPIERTADRNVGQPAEVEDDNDDQPEDTDGASNKTNVSPKNSKIMTNEKYQIVAQVLGVEELEVTEEGTFLNAPLLDTLAEKLTEMKGQAAAAQAAAQEPAQEPANEPAAEPAAEPAQEPAAGEGAQEPAGEGAQEPAQEPAAEPSGEGAQEPAAEPAQEPAQEPAGEGAQEPAQEPAAEPAGEGTELAQVQETLHNAETMIAEKDQTIASLKESLATLNGIAEERDAAIKERNDISASLEKAGLDYAEQGKELSDAQAKIAEHVATIETLKKQVADLKAEVKDLAGKPAPITNADSGVPQDNGTGEAPKQKQRYTREMSYEESRALAKQQAEEAGKK